MKNLYLKATEKFLFLKRNLMVVVFKLLHALKKNFSFHNKHTELLAIWTMLFMIIIGLFFLAIKSSLLVMFLIFISSVAIMFIGVLIATYYLHALKYHNQKKLLPKIHNLLNKSFKLRALFHFVKIPRFSVLNNITKTLKLAS